MKKFIALILLIANVSASAINLSSYSDLNYRDDVQTVLLHQAKNGLAKPVIALDDMTEQLSLQFDILSAEAPYLYYTFIHCTNDWKPSAIQPIDYISGFFSKEIENYRFSINTLVDYVHYELLFPQDDMTPKLSGNYLLVVYSDDRLVTENVYFTRRFMVVDNIANINVEIPRYPYDLNFGTNCQQLDIKLAYPDLFNSRAGEYCNIAIQQNSRWDNAVVGLKPSYVYPDYISYENNPKTVFESGNQYLRFNISNMASLPEKTQSVLRGDEHYSVTLYPDQKRNVLSYIDDEDLCGEKYIYLERQDLDATIEAEYVMVEFFLEWPQLMTDADVYVMGALTDWNLDEKSKMEYDFDKRGYHLELLLKQGYYDYIYAVREKGADKASVAPVAGDFWETTNEYSVFVYLFDYLNNYDRLIGTTTVKSH